ncbi:uncharacterized protein LOC132941466 isoform X2 [Metopolophium dirhodum]|uniref:uncharacterized protein LOC132941466 isoform X2 n=1 Tax=Metopolophium dirhodum TaxID=44670 RepID=UPI0029902D26|nr:uncharacterized protein LOC132941466 isoform X2 [Metopolophium dirhodum]
MALTNQTLKLIAMTIIMNYQLMVLVIIIPVQITLILCLRYFFTACVDDMLISPSKNIRTFVKSPSKTPVFESIDSFCMVENVSPYRRNKHFVLSPNILARAEKNKKRNLSESPRNVYPSPETFQSLLENKQKTSPKPNKLKNSSEDQFKKLILYNLLVLKHSIRNINEKLTLVVERQISHNYNVEESNDLTLEYSNLDCLLPIDEEDTLDNIEEQIRNTMHH